jgi:uncharacterized protein (TIGR00297 family)
MPLSPDTKREVARKILHMSMGLFALCLRWLAPWQAALCALAALLHNLYIFPHYGMKKLERPEEKASGYSGMIGYPAVVLVLILLGWGWALRYCTIDYQAEAQSPTHMDLVLRESVLSLNMGLVAAAWLFLAVGDAFGALCGLLLGGPKLPWNAKKTWSGMCGFVLFGVPAAFFGANFVAFACGLDGYPMEGARVFGWHALPLFLLAGIVAAILESLPDQLDDNLAVPTVAWIVLVLGLYSPIWWEVLTRSPRFTMDFPSLLVLLPLNAALACVAFGRGWVDRWGFLLGLLFGTVVAYGLGVPGYSLLLLFYAVANGSTTFGKGVKEGRGIAEAHGGQRRTGSVFSKGFVPAVFALLSFPAFVASLATYAADTAASEFGKTSSGKTFSLRSLKVVPAGSAGGISLRGTLAGLIVLALFGCVIRWCYFWFIPLVPVQFWYQEFPFLGFALSTVFCFFFESWFNEWNASRSYFSKEIIHVMLGLLAGILTFSPAVARGVFLMIKVALG